MTTTVTKRDELVSVSPEETIRGYQDEGADTATALAAIVDATDCIYFEGALPNREGGVARVESIDEGSVVADLSETLPGFYVAAVEPLMFSPAAALESTAEERGINADELAESDRRELVAELRSEFQTEHELVQDIDNALRIELRVD